MTSLVLRNYEFYRPGRAYTFRISFKLKSIRSKSLSAFRFKIRRRGLCSVGKGEDLFMTGGNVKCHKEISK